MPGSDTQQQAPIQAYYKLSFPNFEYYLQTLSVTIGRRPQSPSPPAPKSRSRSPQLAPEPAPEIKQEETDALLKLAELASTSMGLEGEASAAARAQSPHPSTSSARRSRRSQSHSSSSFPHVDVDLGPLKSVSRLHARIDYDDTIDKFVLYVNGRNGAWVDGEWVGCGGRVALGARTKIQIASRAFYFILPNPVDPQPPLTPETTPDAEAPADTEGAPVSPRTPSPVPPKRRTKATRPSSRSASPPHKYVKVAPQPPPPLPDGPTSSASTQSSKTHVSREAFNAHQQETDSEHDELVEIDDLQQIDLDELNAIGPSKDEGGPQEEKGKGKAGQRPKGSAGRKGPVKGRANKGPKLADQTMDVEESSSLFVQPGAGSSHAILVKPPKLVAKSPPDPNLPRQPKKYMTQRLIAKTALMQMPRPSPENMPPKPPFTYAILCYRAIIELGGKASLSEIVNWIREKHEWYRWNDECGWESSVRHNLSSNPGFVKSRRDAEVERIVSETGQQKKIKGFFWSIDPKAEESFAEKEREIIEAGSRAKAQQKAKPKEGPEPSAPMPTMASSSSKPAMPVPMMAPRGMPGAPPPPPVGMTMVPPMMHPGPPPPMQVPHMLPPPMMLHPPPLPGMSIPPAPQPQAVMRPPIHPIPPSLHHVPPPPASPAFPQALPDVCLSITVGPPPPGAAADPAAGSSPYVDGPPITLHNGALFLNPTIFSGLSKAQLDELQSFKAQKALEILMGYTKNYVKEQILKKGKVKAKPTPANAPKKADGIIPPSSSVTPPGVDAASILAVANLATASASPQPAPTPTPIPSQAHPPYPPQYTYPTQNGWGYPQQPPQFPPGYAYPHVPQFPPSHVPTTGKHPLEMPADSAVASKKPKVDGVS